jgi:hypothetical protein
VIEEGCKVSVRIFWFAVILFIMVLPVYAQHEGVAWQKSYSDAVAKSKETGKPLFADFTSEIN